jgi:MutS domain V
MKALLMYPDRDFDAGRELPPQEPELAADLELGTLLTAMAGGDQFLYAVARQGLHTGLTSPAEITYRQHVLADCVAHPDVARDLYDLAVAGVSAERQVFGFMFRDSPDTILHRSLQLIRLYVEHLRRLAGIAGEHAAGFRSEGFTRFFAMLASELSDEYFAEMEERLTELQFRRGTLISARLGRGGKGAGFVLRRHSPARGWHDRLRVRNRGAYTFTVAERDEAGLRKLSELTSRGVNDTASSVAQSCDHIKSFFSMLRAELGFYVGCLNLREQLTNRGEPVCYPAPAALGGDRLTARGLYDASLALTQPGGGEGAGVTGNDVAADGKQLIMITGANQGGKSTFLRSLGQAQLMMQAGMFVAADSFGASVCSGVFTHFKREEDATMEKGKLDEELDRMSVITGRITPGALLLCNESFASTNEREGSEIARQIIRACTEAGIRIAYVTHLYDLAESCYAHNAGEALFLRAQRRPDGQRTFRLPEGEPLPTSYGEDLYRQVFGPEPVAAPA